MSRRDAPAEPRTAILGICCISLLRIGALPRYLASPAAAFGIIGPVRFYPPTTGARSPALRLRPSTPPPPPRRSVVASSTVGSAEGDESAALGSDESDFVVPVVVVVDRISPDSMSSLFGGDYAGLSATFSADTGELIRVPEHLVPDSLVEWGRVPSCLEILASEDFIEEGGEDRGTDATTATTATTATPQNSIGLERKVVTVLPEVGCGVDNLETSRSSESMILAAPGGGGAVEGAGEDCAVVVVVEGRGIAATFESGSIGALDVSLPPLRGHGRRRVETVFALSPEEEEEDAGRRRASPEGEGGGGGEYDYG